MRIDKGDLLDKLTNQLLGGAEGVLSAAYSARQASIEAPGTMVSRYDSTKEEQGYLADGLNLRHTDIVDGINEVKGISLPKNPDRVVLGSLVRLENGRGEDTYFILPYGGGEYIETEEGEVSVITPKSPIFKQMEGKRAGDWFTLNAGNRQTTYQVLEIK